MDDAHKHTSRTCGPSKLISTWTNTWGEVMGFYTNVVKSNVPIIKSVVPQFRRRFIELGCGHPKVCSVDNPRTVMQVRTVPDGDTELKILKQPHIVHYKH